MKELDETTAANLRGMYPELAGTLLDIPPGWLRLCDDLVSAIGNRQIGGSKPCEPITIEQMKTKFGALTCYVSPANAVEDLIRRAWLRSTLTCERCGAIGRLRLERPLSGVRTTCDRCENTGCFEKDRFAQDVGEFEVRIEPAKGEFVDVRLKFTSTGQGGNDEVAAVVAHRDDIGFAVAHLVNREMALRPHRERKSNAKRVIAARPSTSN